MKLLLVALIFALAFVVVMRASQPDTRCLTQPWLDMSRGC